MLEVDLGGSIPGGIPGGGERAADRKGPRTRKLVFLLLARFLRICYSKRERGKAEQVSRGKRKRAELTSVKHSRKDPLLKLGAQKVHLICTRKEILAQVTA